MTSDFDWFEYFERWMRRFVDGITLLAIAAVGVISYVTEDPAPVIGGSIGALIVWATVRVLLRATR